MKNKAIVITGSHGALGEKFFNSKLKDEWSLYRINIDLNITNVDDESYDINVLKEYDSIVVIHMASPQALQCELDPTVGIEVNIKMINSILDDKKLDIKWENFN